jgi:hypothetical protein
MKKEGGCEWYQSIGLLLLYISADYKKFFKGPRPFKQQKTYLSGLTTFHVYWPDHVASGVKNSIPGRHMFDFSQYNGCTLYTSIIEDNS